MIPKDTTEEAVRLSLNRAEMTGGGVTAKAARRAINYYEDITYQIDDLYDQLKVLYANNAKWKARPKACYNLTRAVTDAVSTLYSDPVIYIWEDKQAEEMWNEYVTGWASLMSDIDRYTFLGGTLGVRPVVKDGELRFDLYLADQIEYVQEPDDILEAQQITVSWTTGQGISKQLVVHFWTDAQYVETVDGVPTGKVEDNPYQTIPIALFRNSEPRWDFFGQPAADLTAAGLALNAMHTDLNHVVRWQSHGQLVLVGAPPNYSPPIGADTFISVSNSPGASGADARYIQPAADIASIINAINQNLDMLFSSRRIPKAAVVAVQGDSGVSLVAQQASLRDYRKARIAAFRPQEEALIALTLKVLHYHATGELRDFDPPEIVYTELRAPMALEVQQEWDWKLRLGVASPVDVMLSLFPGMSREDAEKQMRENLAWQRDRFAAQMPANAPARPVEPLEDEAEGEDEEEGEE